MNDSAPHQRPTKNLDRFLPLILIKAYKPNEQAKLR